jgi:hypothetical protein
MRPSRGVGTMVVLVKPTTVEMGRPYGMSVFAILVWLAMLVLSSSSASALPVASGSKCTADWVNNAGAMACFIQRGRGSAQRRESPALCGVHECGRGVLLRGQCQGPGLRGS